LAVLFLAAIAAATPSVQAEAMVRIERAQRVTDEDWRRSPRKREIVVREGGREVKVRQIEFE
jgi:hypothetical protein